MSDIYERKCPNWIQTFKDWTLERSQAKEDLIEWTAIWTIAAALRRRVYIPKTYLGSWTCYPHLYLMIVGPSGIGKTTTLRYSYDLLRQVPDFPKPSTIITLEALIDDLVKSPDSSIYMTVDEFGELFMKDKSNRMFDFITTIYDGKLDIGQKTMGRGVEAAIMPCLNLAAGTTQEWIADNIPVNILNGGFGSRFIWTLVDGVRRRRLFYKQEWKENDFNKLEGDLLIDLIHISKNLEGEFHITDEALEYMENWNTEFPKRIKFKKISGYINRKAVYVLKLAMLMHVAYSDKLELNLLDFKNAINLIEGIEPTLPRIFEGIGKNEYSLEMRDIAAFVNENAGVTEEELRNTFQAAASPAKLSELIDGLLLGGVLRTELGESNKRVFYLKED